jgi:polar amino acid transport system substrate-binding protein
MPSRAIPVDGIEDETLSYRLYSIEFLLIIVLDKKGVKQYEKTDVAVSGYNPDDNNDDLIQLTIQELAEYDGTNGKPAYVAVDGVIYDVTDNEAWTGGSHAGQLAGTDLSDSIDTMSPHGRGVLDGVPVVGEIVALSVLQDPLRVGMDLRYPPFETVTLEGDPEGISVDVAIAFGYFIGRRVEIVNTDFSALIPAIQTGEIDIAIASMSITPEREQSVDFSDPYFYFKIISLVNAAFASANGITEDSTVEDLLAIEGALYTGIASQVSATIPESYGKEVREVIDLGTAIEEVAQGEADILLMSANPVVNGYKANPNTTMVVWDAFVSSPIGMAVQEGNAELLAQANAFIATFADDGGLYEDLAADWDDVLIENLGRYGLEFYITE